MIELFQMEIVCRRLSEPADAIVYIPPDKALFHN